MYFIPQPRKIEYKEAEEGQNGFILSYQGYIVLDPLLRTGSPGRRRLYKRRWKKSWGLLWLLQEGKAGRAM